MRLKTNIFINVVVRLLSSSWLASALADGASASSFGPTSVTHRGGGAGDGTSRASLSSDLCFLSVLCDVSVGVSITDVQTVGSLDADLEDIAFHLSHSFSS